MAKKANFWTKNNFSQKKITQKITFGLYGKLMKGVPSYLFVIFLLTHLLKPQTTEYITKLSPVPARLVLAASTPKLSFCCLPKSTDTKNFLFCCQPKPTDAKKISLCCTSLQYNREGGRNACSELGCPSL